ncbi:hypothetical protein HG530_008185 [Fusarium avenaceum]|nr:hypothetical protein HG530_008185 [Fusarium avenaceum]
MRLLQIRRERCGTESVGGIVRKLNGFCFGLEGGDDNDWSEDLLAEYTHGGLHVGEDCLLIPLVSNFANCVEGVDELLDEFLVDGLLHENSRRRRADLTLVGHDAEMRPLHSLIQLCIVKNQQRRLSARLEGDVLERLGRNAHDASSCGRGAGKGDLIHQRMLHQRSTRVFSKTVDDVDHAGRETSLLDELAQDQQTQRGLLGGFNDNCVSTRKRRTKLPGGHGKRVVPRDDLCDDANGLSNCVGELLGCCVDGLAKCLIGPARIIAYDTDSLDEIVLESLDICLAIVPRVNGSEELPLRLNQICQTSHEQPAV